MNDKNPDSNPKVKICGITTLQDARYCAGAGADYLGFIQFEDSPRFVATAMARDIIEWIHGPQPVGVFVNEDADTVNRVSSEADFALVQLHGNESPAVCADIDRQVIKAFHVVHDASAEQLRMMMDPYRPHVDYFLLDTHKTNLWGGTGESFNWRLARELSQDFPLFLSGGLTPGNVKEAVETIRPAVVDVSSGLETSPGTKDLAKVDDFFETVAEIRQREPRESRH